ncbi:pirin family protein [Parasphingorhabdus sp. JC815]|uniref:pirin family protein n=1 Tax=Parasphingorhabdus sp. JC815 TaxID=3232140 RepID=UPI0034588C19
MIDIRPFDTLGAANHGWLNARHHFSFANYFDEARMGFGNLRVWNDDEIAAQSGFPQHPHRDMEIITYVREGAITHKDNLGNEGRTEAGDVQVMSAGSGIAHSEYNMEDEKTRIFQIWIEPRSKGGEPRWGAKPFPKDDRTGNWTILASGLDEDRDALMIRADAQVAGIALKEGETASWTLKEGRKAYLVAATGSMMVGGEFANERDGVAIEDIETIEIKALEDTEIVLVDTI